jgi:hypothetical protein
VAHARLIFSQPLRADEAFGQEQPPWGEPSAFDRPPLADKRIERFYNIWSRALARDNPLDREFTDLMLRLLLIKEENHQLMDRAREIVVQSRLLCARVPRAC